MTADRSPLLDLAARIRANASLGEQAAERVRLLTADRERADFQASIDGGFTESFEDYCTRISKQDATADSQPLTTNHGGTP